MRGSIWLLSISLVACSVTYDVPLMYKKNYVPGTHALLRFDGYYLQPASANMVKPIYFYRDGSAFVYEIGWDSTATSGIPHTTPASWGNYKIDGDTIVLERFNFEQNTNNYRRITLKGVVLNNSIKWILREQNRQNPDVLNYETKFRAANEKPDSSGNWTRTRPQYNK